MQFLVTDIKFDFNDDLDPIYSIPIEDQQLIINDNIGVWEADDAVSYTHLTLPTTR